MKMNFKTLSVMALAGLMVLGSCKKNEQNTNNNGSVLFAGIEQPSSNAKTSLDPSNGAIKWTAGDKIMVNNGSETAEFSLTAGAGETTATFNGPGGYGDANNYVAAYPAENVTNIAGTVVTFNIPSEQTMNAGNGFGNGANPMVAYGADENLQFKSVFGGLTLRLTGTGLATRITKVVLTSNISGQMLNGQFTYDVAANEHEIAMTGGTNTVTLNMPDGVTLANGQSQDVFVMLPPILLTNFTIAVYDGDYQIKTATHNNSEQTLHVQVNVLSPYITYNVALPAGQANTVEAVQAIIADTEQTGPVTIVGGELDFQGYDVPANQQIIIAENAEVEISNLEATRTTGANPAMEIKSGAKATLNNVTLTSTSTAQDSRAINVKGTNTKVTFNNCTIDGGTAGYSRGLQVMEASNVTVNVNGGSIHAGHYAINLPNTATNVTVNLSNNSVSAGWAAVNIWGNGNRLYAEDCELSGLNDKNYAASGDNDFGTLVFNKEGSTIELNHCIVNAKAQRKNPASPRNAQWAVLVQAQSSNNTLILRNNTKIYGITAGTDKFIGDGTGRDNWLYNVGTGFVSNVASDTTIDWDGSDPD